MPISGEKIIDFQRRINELEEKGGGVAGENKILAEAEGYLSRAMPEDIPVLSSVVGRLSGTLRRMVERLIQFLQNNLHQDYRQKKLVWIFNATSLNPLTKGKPGAWKLA